MNQTIYFIRHGQTDWNAERRFQGRRDIPLNATGRGQASANGTALSELLGGTANEFDFVSSPLGRTRETMERLREAMGLAAGDYHTDERLLELCFGEWEGHTLDELGEKFPAQMAERAKSKWHYVPPGDGAESYETLSWRVASWLNQVNRPTVCVSHGGVIRTILKLVGAMDEREAPLQDVAQDRILRFEDGKLVWL